MTSDKDLSISSISSISVLRHPSDTIAEPSSSSKPPPVRLHHRFGYPNRAKMTRWKQNFTFLGFIRFIHTYFVVGSLSWEWLIISLSLEQITLLLFFTTVHKLHPGDRASYDSIHICSDTSDGKTTNRGAASATIGQKTNIDTRLVKWVKVIDQTMTLFRSHLII